MIKASDFIEEGRRRNFLLYTGVPCSYLKPFINYVIDKPDLQYVGVANEGEGVAVAAGANLAGANSVVMFQNSGLGNAVNAITSLNQIFKIPSLIITTLRGEPGGPADEPQHKLMGEITTSMLELMNVEWEFFPEEKDAIPDVFDRAEKVISRGLPFALVMKKGSVEDYQIKTTTERRNFSGESVDRDSVRIGKRSDVLTTVQNSLSKDDLIVATTGYTGRELFALTDNSNQLYSVGSMGCASSISLGIALISKQNRVITLDGDGAVLMRMGALATIGYYRPKNFLHILLNNELHESTGGQSTVSHSVDFANIALSCGYQKVVNCKSLEELKVLVENPTTELTFCLANIEPGVMEDLPRPNISPEEVAIRFRRSILSNEE